MTYAADEAVLAQVREFITTTVPFNRWLGMQVRELSMGFARLSIPFRDELVGDPLRPALHGGVLSTLIDAAGGAAGFTTLDVGDTLSTLDLRIDYLRPGELKEIVADARVTRTGNRVTSVDVRCYHPDNPERDIAHGKGVYNIRRRR